MERHVGYWWHPDSPDDPVTGTLAIARNGKLRLELIRQCDSDKTGALSSLMLRQAPQGQPTETLMVYGQSKSGTLFTLYDGFIRGSSWGSGGIVTADAHFDRGFVGACIDAPSSLPVERIFVHYPGLKAWLNPQPFEVRFESEMKRVEISATVPETEYVEIDRKGRFFVTWTREGPAERVAQTNVSLKLRPWLGIEHASPVVQGLALEDVTALGELLSLLLGSPTCASKISMMSPDYRHTVGPDRAVELRALGEHFQPPQSFRGWFPGDVLVPHSMLQPQLASILTEWFRLRERCWGLVVPYLGTQRSPAPLAEGRFFDLAAAAESTHSHLRQHEVEFPKTEAQRTWQSIRSHIPKERRAAYSAALRRANELTYKQRLERLLARFPSLTAAVVGDCKAQETFCSLVRDLRHQRAHGLPKQNNLDVTGETLVKLASKLKVIIDAWLLAELGLDAKSIEERMRKTSRYWFYANRETWPWQTRD